MKCNDSYKTYPLYLKLSALSCMVITLIMSFTMYIVWPGLEQISYTLALVSEIIGGIIILIVWFLWFLLAIASAGAITYCKSFYIFAFSSIIGIRKGFYRYKKR